jgi:hypothetical protein
MPTTFRDRDGARGRRDGDADERSWVATCRSLPGREEEVAELLVELVGWVRTQPGTRFCTAPMCDVDDPARLTLVVTSQGEPTPEALLGTGRPGELAHRLAPLLDDGTVHLVTLERG